LLHKIKNGGAAMSEVIRISEPTYNRLESLARGFDTPGNVIDRLLDFYEQHHKNILSSEVPTPRGEKKIKRVRGALPQKEYLIPILKALVEKGGKAEQKEVFDIIEQKMRLKFGNLDIEILRDGYTKRWQKNAAFQRLRMVKEGFLKSNSPRGLWEITEKGRKFLNDTK
jgi:restriction system protein